MASRSSAIVRRPAGHGQVLGRSGRVGAAFAALGLVGLLSAVLVSRAGAATQTSSPVTTFAGAVVGTSTLTRTGSGISFSLSTTGLESGHAVTVWWMVLNPDGSVRQTDEFG